MKLMAAICRNTLFLLLFCLNQVVYSAPIPQQPGPGVFYVDQANLLTNETKTKINRLGTDLETKSGAQVKVLTLKSLENTPIEEYALSVLRQWRLGDKEKNNGVLIVITLAERQSRIEVGYGLEGALPDAKTGRIQDDYMVPYFSKGDYDSGIWNGYKAVIGETAKEYNLDLAATPRAPPQQQTTNYWDNLPLWGKVLIYGGLFLLLLVDWIFFNGFFTYFILSIFMRGRGGPGGPGGNSGGGSGGGGGSTRRW